MTAIKALKIVLLWGITFALIGGVIGATLGTFAPEYYRSVFHAGRSRDFHPLQVGIGMGVTQGLAIGVALALGVLALLVWRESRHGGSGTSSESKVTTSGLRGWWRSALWGGVTCLSVLVFSFAAFILGGVLGQVALYQTWTEQKLERVATILDTQEFPNVHSNHTSDAQVYLSGTVRNQAKRQALHEKLVFTFGSEDAEEMLSRVEVGH
jgi:hypothetical protein